MNEIKTTTSGKCPVMRGVATASGISNMDRWSIALNLGTLRQHDTKTNPMGISFHYRKGESM